MRKTIVTITITAALSINAQSISHDLTALTDIVAASAPTHTSVGKIKVDSVDIDDKKKIISVFCNETTSYIPFNANKINDLKTVLKQQFDHKYSKYKIEIYTNKYNLDQLAIDTPKKNIGPKEKVRFITYDDRFCKWPEKGLPDANIAMWQSHGWYFEKKLNRWEWQRARIMQTVEDLYTQSYVVPYLMPMLENAGAYVLCPRERDINDIEIIIDNDKGLATDGYSESDQVNWSSTPEGFAHIRETYADDEQSNPFKLGSARIAPVKSNPSASWNAEIPVTRDYAIYVSYPTLKNSTDKAVYTINADNGRHKVTVNQRMGGGTWIYLGKYPLRKGKSSKPIVELSATGKNNAVVGADAVKIGGGKGNIARRAILTDENGNEVNKYITSGYPRFTEGARYWLQWAGMPDSVYTPNKGANDYKDDYTSRALWVNYMTGGSSMYPKHKGLGIPVDLSFAFHSDAGTTYNDSIIGTLGIYSTNDNKPSGNGSSRLANRDLTDLVITQIVNDVRALHEPNWTRRGLWDKKYYEARVPQVPTMLLELLSHQNFADMKYGLDPTFRFDVSRAIYKGMLKFIADRDGRNYIVQPLPVNSFKIGGNDSNTYHLSWKETVDSLEETANPTYYIIEHRIDNGSFTKEAIVDKPEYVFKANDDKIHSFRIIAGNDGGVSFPSEILALCHKPGKTPVRIVNGFTRVSAPDNFDAGTIAGFYDSRDHGVPYMQDICFIGSQFEFRRNIPWMDDDAAGFGASRANYEDKVIAGNNFDYVYLHGKAIKNAGYGFISSSVAAYSAEPVESTPLPVDLILGKQKETKTGTGLYGTKYKTFPAELKQKIEAHCNNGGNIMISGSYVATDLWDNAYSDSITADADKKFATEVLGYHWRVGQASVEGNAYEVVSPFKAFDKGVFDFYTNLNSDSYAVESPDSFFAANENGATIMRYGENNLVAATAMARPEYRTVVIGFPFESIIDGSQRNTLMKQILNFFEKK